MEKYRGIDQREYCHYRQGPMRNKGVGKVANIQHSYWNMLINALFSPNFAAILYKIYFLYS
jgi:hypothetical protein